ncbi:AMP-binding protein [Burkholderia pseudomallei]|nr:AMP-binding protein [Burkholderia pseudomallei]
MRTRTHACGARPPKRIAIVAHTSIRREACISRRHGKTRRDTGSLQAMRARLGACRSTCDAFARATHATELKDRVRAHGEIHQDN